ncbi:MAG: hypothetical protein GC164_12525 [Phycisphaera sp.]|nr:hypothetical protein [Phycisphaera sp.]
MPPETSPVPSRTQTDPPALVHPNPHPALAHELANLLDGSMRHVRMVMRSLGDEADTNTQSSHDETDEELIGRLQTVNTAMQQMATLVRQWMPGFSHTHVHAQPDPADLPRTLAACVAHAVEMVADEARELKVTIRCDLDVHSRELDGGAVYPVITNALRNSLDAMRSAIGNSLKQDSPGVRLATRLDGDDLVLTVTDNGPGLNPDLLDSHGRFQFGQTDKPTGHGIGLGLAYNIARSLNGSLRLTNAAGGGALLMLRVPLTALSCNIHTP